MVFHSVDFSYHSQSVYGEQRTSSTYAHTRAGIDLSTWYYLEPSYEWLTTAINRLRANKIRDVRVGRSVSAVHFEELRRSVVYRSTERTIRACHWLIRGGRALGESRRLSSQPSLALIDFNDATKYLIFRVDSWTRIEPQYRRHVVLLNLQVIQSVSNFPRNIASVIVVRTTMRPSILSITYPSPCLQCHTNIAHSTATPAHMTTSQHIVCKNLYSCFVVMTSLDLPLRGFI